ncbi:maleylacetoacetate isomerase [Boseongicola sp. H5]|uniref:maleylacetoacetate isomerase n=1 Tax=Boseongicola sp. H5 TaxID=2763261 RepID=UPI001D0A7476|nr:maleylacetoacetate isomerase [Boseongicola sp. H5]
MSETLLYDYPRSSASYRVRIALNLAGITYRTVRVDLLAKQHKSDEHLARNPQGLVPVLQIDGHRLTQSLAIFDYLDQTRDLGFLPKEPAARAKAQALAHVLAVDVHPVCNLSVVTHATGGQDPARSDWMRHFIRPGLLAFEALLGDFTQAPFTIGPRPSLPDLCLIPQLYNADRWGVDYADCARIRAVRAACAAHPAFTAAAPDTTGP